MLVTPASEVWEPPKWSNHFPLYEQALQQDNEAQLRRASIGGQFNALHTELGRLASSLGPSELVEMFYTCMYPIGSYIAEQVEVLDELRGPDSNRCPDSQLYSALFPQIALLPALFGYSGDEAREQRRQLISNAGMYGIAGNALQAVAEQPISRSQRVGDRHDHTVLALLCKLHSPDAAPRPALPYEDKVLGQDMVFYTRQHGRTQRIPLQAKNDEVQPWSIEALARGTPIIGGRAIGNHKENGYWPKAVAGQTTRAIINELAGQATAEEEKILRLIARDLLAAAYTGRSFMVTRDQESRIDKNEQAGWLEAVPISA